MQFEWLILAIMLPFIVLPTPERAWLLLLIPFLWFMRKVVDGYFVTNTPLNWQIYLLWLMIGVSLFATFDFAHSLEKIAGLIYATAVYFALIAWIQHSPKRLWLGVMLILLIGTAIASLALFTVQIPGEFPVLRQMTNLIPQRIISIPGRESSINPNEIAGILLWSLPLGVVLFLALIGRLRMALSQLRPWRTVFLILALGTMIVIMSLMLLLSQSRAAILGLLAALFILLAILIAHRSKLVFILSVVVMLLFVGSFFAFADTDEVATAFFPQVGLRGDSLSTVSGLESRVEVWHRAILAIQDFPFTGMGMNNFRIVAPELYPFFIFPGDTDFGHAHNQWLQTALDLGLPGLVAYVSLWIGVGLMLWRSWRQTTDYWLRALSLGFTAVIMAYFVYGWIDTVALGARPGFLWWFLIGLIASLHEQIIGTANAHHDSLAETR